MQEPGGAENNENPSGEEALPRIEYLAHSSSGRDEEDDELLGESDESDKEMEEGMSALQLRIIFGAVFFY